jgi:DNA-directed RNA polymerase beta' subunit
MEYSSVEIQSVHFGTLSAKQVLSQSVCEIKYDKQKKGSDLENTLNDPRMGPVEDDKVCPTCKQTMHDCPGHFGHMILNCHIIYPLTYGLKTVHNFLKSHCFQCSRLAFSSAKIDLLSLDKYTGVKRYTHLLTEAEKVETCWNCKSQMAKFFIRDPNNEPKIMMYYKSMSEKKSKENTLEVATSEI